MTSTLTDRIVRKLKPRAGAYYISDSTIKGLQIRVAQDGSKSWSVRYRIGHRQRRLTLGDAAVIPLGDKKSGARALARQALLQVENNIDPAEAKAQRREADTVADFAETFINEYAKPKKKSWKADDSRLRNDVLPVWKHRLMKEITRRDVRKLIDGIAARAPISANRVRALLSKFFAVAIKFDVVEVNPVTGTDRPGQEQQRDRVLTHDEIRQMWTACDKLSLPLAAGFRLRLATAQRANEVLDIAWDELDLEAGWWTIPAERSKNKLSHRVPLSSTAIEIFTALRVHREEALKAGRATPSPFVLRNARGKRQQAEAAATFEIANFRGHDLRRTAASLMAGSGVQRLVISKILNHVEKGVTAIYDRHSYDNEKRIALDAWARTLTAIIEKKDGANVVAFARS